MPGSNRAATPTSGNFLAGFCGEILHAPFGRASAPDLGLFRHARHPVRDDDSLTSKDAGFRH